MARFNLRAGRAAVERIRERRPRGVRPAGRSGSSLDDDEVARVGSAAPRACTSRSTTGLGIHPQDDFFLDREVWDLAHTPTS